MEDKTKLSSYTIEELIAERDKTTQAIQEADQIIKSLAKNRQAVLDEITLRKAPISYKNKMINLFSGFVEASKTSKKEIISTKVKSANKPASRFYEAKISDHALLRYIERILELDVETIRENILTENNRRALEMGATRIKSQNVEFRAECGRVITIVEC